MHPTAVIKITTLILAILYAEYTLPSYLFSADAYAITSAAHLQIRNYTFSFDEYINEYGKWYSNDDEYEMRRSLFEQRLEAVRVHNEDPVLSLQWRKGINQFSDRTDLELQMFRGYDRPLGHYLRSRDSSRLNEDHDRVSISDLKRLEMLPREVDWRKVPGVLTAVKEQGNCGSCWAFAAVETIESRWFLSTGKIMDLSVQGIVSCAPNVHKCGGSGGCNGGTAELAFDYVMHSGGLPSEWSNGYLQFYNNVTTKCPPVKQGDPRAMVGSYKRVSSNDMLAVMEALQSGPVAAVVDASTWHSYESGIYTGCDPNNVVLDHVVELVGYGEDIQSDGSVHPFWVIRNSWGPDVGENGFFRIAREKSTPVCGIDYKPQDGSDCEGGPDQVKVCGTCGILYDVSYPDVVY